MSCALSGRQHGKPNEATIEDYREKRDVTRRQASAENRPSGDRTAPYWRHVMVMDIYVAMANGVWLYEPKAHTLLPHSNDDIRARDRASGLRRQGAPQPRLMAHGERMADISSEERRLYASVDTGFIGRTYICSAPRRDWPRSFGDRSTIQARARPAASGSAIRDLRANGGISSRVSATGPICRGKRKICTVVEDLF